MVVPSQKFKILNSALFLCSLLFFATALYSENEILGEIKFVGPTKFEKTSGVWIDGQYVGYLNELKGTKKVLLMPGEHEVLVRQAGFIDFSQKIVLEPGEKKTIHVSMEIDPAAQWPEVTAELKISVRPRRAAVFLDDGFMGHVDEFDGIGHAMLLSPGKHRVKITLPGYQTFETEINLAPKQKFKLKTDLFLTSITEAGPLIKQTGAKGTSWK